MSKDSYARSRKPSAGSPPSDPSIRPSPSDDGEEAGGFLLKMLEACGRHRRRHNRGDQKINDKSSAKDDGWCLKELKSFAKLLPRILEVISTGETFSDEYQCDGKNRTEEGKPMVKGASSVKESNGEDDVGKLCALYRAIALGAFCPHAVQCLFTDSISTNEKKDEDNSDATDGDIPKAILPKITQLLQYLALDPVRTALMPLKHPPKKHSSLGEATRLYCKEEDIGFTIAALLSLLQDDQLRLSVAYDLINLSNDLSEIDESQALFCPPIKKEEEEGTRSNNNLGKIRVHVFTEVSRLLKKESNENDASESSLECVISIPSQRSLLALQLGVWTALRHFLPLVLAGDEPPHSSTSSFFSVRGQGQKIELIRSLLSCSRSTSLVSLRPSCQEPQFLAWRYSPLDVMVHKLLMLRTKLAIVGIFTDIVMQGDGTANSTRVSTSLIHDMGDLTLAPSIDLALLAVETAKYHLLWGHTDSAKSSECSQDDVGAISQSSKELEHNLTSMFSWAASNFLALAVLFPVEASAVSKKDIWSHSFSQLIDCIPIMTGPTNDCSSEYDCLRRVALRIIHAILLSNVGSAFNRLQPLSTTTIIGSNTCLFSNQFGNRCLARGYFSHLFQLVKHKSSISAPVVSIVVHLLQSLSMCRLIRDDTSCENLVETACLNALGALDPDHDHLASDARAESPLVQLGSKRRKLEPCQHEKDPLFQGATIQSALTHAISDSLVDAQNIKTSLAEGNQHNPISGGPEVVSLVTELDTILFRGVTGTLRMLLTLRSQIRDHGSGPSSTENAISQLFECVKFVSGVLVLQKSKHGKLTFVEPKLFYSVLTSIVSIGLHACRMQRGTPIKNLLAREALSHCAIVALPMIDCDRCVELDKALSSGMIAEANTGRLCGGTCFRLASMIGAIKSPYPDICLCKIVGESNESLTDEVGTFAFEEILPLQCRCIFLAMLCPVASDSPQYETTLSSIQCILADSSHSQPPVVVKTALLGLPNLFLSLATRKGGHGVASAKYLTIVMESFNIKDRVIQYAKSDIQGIRVSAMLSMARLARVYTAASLVASGEHGGAGGDQNHSASLYLWQQLNPTNNGIHTVVLRLQSVDGCFSFTASNEAHFHPAIGLSLFSSHDSSPFCLTNTDSHRLWMASLVYLQSALALATEPMIRSSNALEFFTNKQHYDILDKLAHEMNGDLGGRDSVSTKIPPPVWLFLVPFLGQDTSTKVLAANAFGRTLLCNGCKVFSAFFIPKSETRATLNELSIETSRRAVDKLFFEIDFLLGLSGLSRDLLCSRELYFSPGRGAAAPQVSDVRIAVSVFRSLCQSLPLNTAIREHILERSLLALIRIWVASSGGFAYNSESSTDHLSHSSLSSVAFDGIAEIFKCRVHPSSLQSMEILKCVDNIMSNIFVEFLLPPIQQVIVATRYQLLSVFIGSFLLPAPGAQSLRTQSSFETFCVGEIVGYIDSVFPSVLVQMIKDEDHEAILMCTAFRMYLISEGRKVKREEDRVHKKCIDELTLGNRQGHQRSGSFARSLVPGMSISTKKLTENAKLLCIKKDVIQHLLPQLLLHPSRSPLNFFTTKVCQSELNYPDIFKELQQSVLKTLVWELGGDDPEEDKEEEMHNSSSVKDGPKRKNVILALTKGYLLKEGSESSKVKHTLMSPSQDSTADDELCMKTAGMWITQDFMYLLVNIVIKQWKKVSECEKFQVVKCLRAMLQFLPPSESPQYMPQIMTAINRAISPTVTPDKEKMPQFSKLRFIAVATLFDFVKIVASHDCAQVGENLTTIVVALFPLFNNDDPSNSLARRHAVQMLEWLASKIPSYFSKIPFLPFTSDLKKVRKVLARKGVQIDDIRLLSQQYGPQKGTVDQSLLESKFYNRMNILSQLVTSHENRNVRKAVITHMTDLIKANRDLFQGLIVNEELSSMPFLTVVHDSSTKSDSSSPLNDAPDDDAMIRGGFVTKLLIRLLSRCVDETDCDIRDAIASCLGEIGAIDPNRLGKEINSSQFDANSAGSDDSGEWRLANPPWKTKATEYQFRLVTRHLVSGLKSAPAAIDQHKIAFAIQELLKILDTQFGGKKRSQDEKEPPEMTSLLREELQKMDVSKIVESFWTTKFIQKDIAKEKPPPFFSIAPSYYSWLSSLCRFLVYQSNKNKASVWRDFFYACRATIRSQAGVDVTEFLLPLLVLDAICFGVKNDEDAISDEFLRVLCFEGGDCGKNEALMNLREREKAVNAVLTVLDVLRYWMEKETELIHKKESELTNQPSSSSRGRSKRTRNSKSDEVDTGWPAAGSVKKIERLLERIPLSSCATAASKVGMHARALQFLEMEGRRRVLLTEENANPKASVNSASKFLKSHLLDGIDTQLTQMLLGQLNDFDTMVYVAQKSQQLDMRKRLAEEAAEREMYEDWEGALQTVEQLLDSRLSDENQSQQDSAIENTKKGAQKGLLRCLLKLGRLDSALNQAYGMSKQSPVQGNAMHICTGLLPSAVEAAWRLGKWQVLDNLLSSWDDESTFDANAHYQLSFGQTMLSLHSKSQASVLSCLKDSRESIMSSLSSAARDGYARSYPYLLRLHALREVECISSMFFHDQSKFQQTFINAVSSDQWSNRLMLTAPDMTGSNAIIDSRLALSCMVGEPSIEGLMWLDIGKAARKGGLYQVAEHSLTQANVSFCKSMDGSNLMNGCISSSARESIENVKLQVAKLKHDVGETTTALKLIEDDIPASIFLMDEKQLKSYVSNDTSTESGETLARRILQATEWMVCDGLKSSSEIKDRYETVLKLAPNWERAHFNYAKFLDSLFESHVSSSLLSRNPNTPVERARAYAIGTIEICQEYLLGSVQHYGMALQLGQKHVYQALPRLLAMWLEFTSLEEDDLRAGNERKSGQHARLAKNQDLMNKVIKGFASKIPEHLYYTALPQLLSRVVHKNVKTSKNAALILITVLARYPCQSMWSCGWLRFSKSEEKKKAGEEIFYGAHKMLEETIDGKQMQNMLNSSKNLFQFFISLAQFMPKGNSSSVTMKVPTFDTELKNFIPPIQAALSLSPGALQQSATMDVFPSFVPRMRAFNPQLKIMQSKAKPKKLSIFAVPSTVAQRDILPADGKPTALDAGEMHFLVKQEAKGDLRKDSRVQDLNNVINRIFASRKGSSGPNSHGRRLRLQLRTFSVVCLTEDCGILEWVPSTESLRSVITETYNPQFASNSIHRRGSRICNFADATLRTNFITCQDVYFKKGNLDLATKKFDELILKQYLPVMYWWFIQNFSRPQSWFEARTNFTLSTAVWSAVGHIIGLGDRHSENILIDTSSGECVHVDFDCIFDKGLLLPRPEVIPFRLTPNMLDAFGPTGAGGLYTGALTESMRTLRKNRDTLLSVLEPFLNDPVINFKSKKQQKSQEDEDAKTAMDSIEKIEGRLDGEYNLVNPNHKKLLLKGKSRDAPSTVDSAHATKLSVEGQVQKMIMEATSHENLVQVYVGWMPWI